MTSAGGVTAARPDIHREGGGATPTSALHTFNDIVSPRQIVLKPIPPTVARKLCERHHYIGSYPGGSCINFGVFVHDGLMGVAVLGVGPVNVYRLFRGAHRDEVLCLTRLWLDDRLGRNSESRVLSIIVRLMRKHQSIVKAFVAYSDPSVGHTGAIYRAAGFPYVGESGAMPMYRMPDGKVHHSRSLSHMFGTHSLKHFISHGIEVEVVPATPKYTYIALVDPTWLERLNFPVLPYPTIEVSA